MLKNVYPTCCGIDVHKKFVVACVAATDDKGVTTYKTSRFSTFTKGLRSLSAWLSANSCRYVCMESTGKYWVPVFNILETACDVTLAHPKYVKAIRGKKTDKKDAKWIADLFKHDLVVASFIPPLNIRQLRDLMRYRFKLVNLRSSEKARTQNSLTVSNIQIARNSKRLLENPEDTSFDVTPLIHGSMLNKVPDLQLAIDGLITLEQIVKLKVIKAHYGAINHCIEELEQVIRTISLPFESEIKIVSSVPGINEFSTIAVIAQIGTDMSVFPTAKHLCSWAGLTPTNNESAGKKKSVRISCAGAYIKPLLVQCANAIVTSKKHPQIRNRYLTIKKRRGHKKAIIAIAPMLLTVIYHMIKNGEFYNADHYKKLNAIPLSRELTVAQAIAFAKRQGFSVVEAASA